MIFNQNVECECLLEAGIPSPLMHCIVTSMTGWVLDYNHENILKIHRLLYKCNVHFLTVWMHGSQITRPIRLLCTTSKTFPSYIDRSTAYRVNHRDRVIERLLRLNLCFLRSNVSLVLQWLSIFATDSDQGWKRWFLRLWFLQFF